MKYNNETLGTYQEFLTIKNYIQEYLNFLSTEKFKNYDNEDNYFEINSGNFLEQNISPIQYDNNLFDYMKQKHNYDVELYHQKGGEGEGDYYHIVLKIINMSSNDVFYLKWQGYYESYSDVMWYDNNPTLIKPKEI